MTLGNRIRTRRERLGLTQNEIAEMTQLRQNYISRIENDKFEPTATVVVLLAKALDMPVGELLGINNKKTTS
ncbi:MAG: helix-turn-helix transcriptional regulator [Ruminococcus sp.]|nr:helix-turn-helix transcriptional regulator [Ruminococcus sp.]